MLEGTLALMIPILAVGGWIIPVTVKSVLKSQERRLELQMQAQQGRNDAAAQQIDALRQEVAALRDTSTQFDVSLEHNVQRLEDRMGRVEIKTASAQAAPPASHTEQPLGLR